MLVHTYACVDDLFVSSLIVPSVKNAADPGGLDHICLLDGVSAPVSSDDGDAAVPTERYLSVTDSDLSSPPQTSSDLLDGALVLATDSDCGALSMEESLSRTDYNLSFPSVVCSQQDTTANELFNGHLQKGIFDHGRDIQDSEQLKISLFNARSVKTKEKRVAISDFIVDNAVDIMFVTEAWLETW